MVRSARLCDLGTLGLLACAVSTVHCGTRTGLTVPVTDAGDIFDASSTDADTRDRAPPHDSNLPPDSVISSDTGLTPDASVCCRNDQNPGPTSNNCSGSNRWSAWEYIAGCSISIARLELHTNDGSVALLGDDGDRPGRVLFQGALGPPDADGWRGADVVPPITVVAGERYWLAQSGVQCSIAAAGTMFPYYNSTHDLAGPWEGPVVWLTWSAHVIGTCP